MIIKKSLVLITMFFLFSCNVPSNNARDLQSEQQNPAMDKIAYICASVRLEEMKILKSANNWTDETKVSEQFSLYTPGIQGISYYEYKVKTGSKDAGYIIVSKTEMDIEIPEISTEGVTLTEEFRLKTGKKDIKIIRYNWTDSACLDTRTNSLIALKNTNGIIVVNNTNSSQLNTIYNEINEKYETEVLKNKQLPHLNGDALRKYYAQSKNNDMPDIKKSFFLNRLNGSVPVTKIEDTVYLKNKFSDSSRTPDWMQVDINGGELQNRATGCGAVAWAITLGYWSAFKGKSNLFNGLNIKQQYQYYYSFKANSTNIHTGIMALRNDLASWNAIDMATGTWPVDMLRVSGYINRQQYGNSVRHSNAGDFIGIWGEINADRPVVMLINAVSFIVPDHYVVVEGVSKKYWSNTNAIISQGFLVNCGNGGTRKWLYSINWDNPSSVKNLYDAFFLSIY